MGEGREVFRGVGKVFADVANPVSEWWRDGDWSLNPEKMGCGRQVLFQTGGKCGILFDDVVGAGMGWRFLHAAGAVCRNLPTIVFVVRRWRSG